MSLKAKIEAVIYASEEPVTLAQLVGLLGQEGQAELDRRASTQQSLALETGSVTDDEIPLPAEPELLNEEVLARVEEDETPEPETGRAVETASSASDEGAITDTVTPEPAAAENVASENADEQHSSGAESDAPPDPQSLAREEKERARAVRELLRSVLDELVRDYATSDRGLEVREVAHGFRFATKPEYHDAVRGFVKSLKPPLKLSLQALETLAVVSYKQPITAPEISEIRGVDSGGVLGSLMARKLITTAGRKQVIGRPILYKTTKDFLLRFGLKDISELPSIEEFEKMAGELAEPQEEIPMLDKDVRVDSVTGADLEEERDATEPQADGEADRADEAMPVDGRISGPPVDLSDAPGENPSADEAAQQRTERGE